MLGNNTINKVMLMGHIAREPRLHVKDAVKVLCLTVVTVENIKRNGEEYRLHEEFHQIRIPEALVNPQNLLKGKAVYVQGKLQTRKFIDEQNIKRYKTDIIADSIELIDSPTTVEA